MIKSLEDGKSVEEAMDDLSKRVEVVVTKTEKIAYWIIFVIAVIGSLYFIFRTDAFRATTYQSKEEILNIMELQGYTNIKFFGTVKQMESVDGPCLTFRGNYKGSVVAGGYCTPQFRLSDWGIRHMTTTPINKQKLIEDSYK